MKMKKSFLLISLLSILAAAPLSAQKTERAQETAAEAAVSGEETILSKVRKLKPKFGKLPKSADYLVVCKISADNASSENILEDIAEQKDKLRKKGVALLLLCEDKSSKAATGMMKKKKVKLPTVFTSELPKKIKDISLYLPETNSAVTVLDMEGQTLRSGGLSLAGNLLNELSLVEKEKERRQMEAQEEAKNQAALKEWAAQEVDADKYPVAAGLKGITTSPTHGTFDTKADYYIYLYSASWCGLCARIMPQVIETYREMKNTSQPKVEIILMGVDKTAAEVADYRKEEKLPFYTVFARDREVQKLPGFYSVSGIPFCVFVDKDGNQIYRGLGGKAIFEWKDTIEKAKIQQSN